MSDWPTYYKELLKLGNQHSPVSITTLWTIGNKITQDINTNLYCVAGQLYTKNGINYLVRNLLANKNIRYLIMCGQDRSKSGKELIKLWNDKTIDILHKEIKPESITNMVKNVKLIDLRGNEDGKTIKKEINKLDLNATAYGKPETFSEPAEKDLNELECSWPTDTSIFKVRDNSVAKTWLKALKIILKFGDIKHTDAMKMKEVCNLTAVIDSEDPDDFYLPDYLNLTKEKIKNYLPQITGSQNIKGLHYTYGYRLQSHFQVNQVDEIIKKLKADKNARECVGVLFDPNVDHEAEHRPCIVLIQALFNKGRLNLNAYVRSHDMFGGWPLNTYGLRTLQKQICDQANLPIGALTIVSASAHIYDFNWEEALKISKENLKPKFEDDPRGHFKIEINKDTEEIVVKHYNAEGNFLKKYHKKIVEPGTVLKLLKTIDEDLAISLTIHSGYLGLELQKAYTALKLDLNYVQDLPLDYNKN
jgi:thymidylate synthase